jgi:hypothetical protein
MSRTGSIIFIARLGVGAVAAEIREFNIPTLERLGNELERNRRVSREAELSGNHRANLHARERDSN